MNKNLQQKISVGVPTYNSSKYLSACLKSLENLETVNEIIISDDGSTSHELKKTEEIIKIFSKKLPIVFIKNLNNQGAFINKYNLINASTNEYIYILDSDNIAGKNLDKIIKKHILNQNNEKYIIQPNIMYQFWENPIISKHLGKLIQKYKVKFFNNDKIFDIKFVKNSLLHNSGTYDLKKIDPNFNFSKINKDFDDNLQSKWIFWVLNCGNFIVNKKMITKVAEKGFNYNKSTLSVDAIVFTYLWLESGYQIKILKNFYHHHRKREDSISYITREESVDAIVFFIKKVLNFTSN